MGSRIRRLASIDQITRIVISLVLAFVVWGFISWETNPEVDRTVQGIAIEVRNLPDDMQLVGELAPVSVTLKGPENLMNRTNSSEIVAYIDLADVTSIGRSEHAIQVDAPSGLRVIDPDPDRVEIVLDALITRTFPVETVEAAPRPPNVSNVSIDPTSAEVSGTRQQVLQVDHLETSIEITGESESFTKVSPILAVDSNGNVVEGVTVTPDQVSVTVTFSTTGKFVPVTVVCACIEDNQVSVEQFPEAAAIPSTVRITGPDNVISGITELLTTPIDISNLTESDWILDVELDTSKVPAGVTVSDTKVDVWVPIEQERLIFDSIQIIAVNLGEGLEATIDPGRVSFAVQGAAEELEQLEGVEPLAIVDATDRGPGSYRVNVEIVVPAGLSYESVEPTEVQLTITEQAASTEEPTTSRELNSRP